MLDTMTMTKAVGAFCGAFLILLLGKWAAEGLYSVGGHGGEQAYSIPVEEGGGAAEDAAPEVPFEEVYAEADASGGERLWRACQACHKLDGTDGTGPHLNGVVDRDIASVDGFAYSEALSGLEGAWTPEKLAQFLEDPKGYASGTKMTYNGMSDVEDRADLIAYLAENG